METIYGVLQLLLFAATILVLTPLLGSYMASVFSDEDHFGKKVLGWLERGCYRISGIDPHKEMSWQEYGMALLLINVLGFFTLFFLQLIQPWLFLNPQNLPATSIPLAFNTAISFVTNTNWQSYSGETTLSYLTQMVGLTSQNFLSAATGMTALLALARGFTREVSDTLGNFWADFVRTLIYLLIPLSILWAILLVEEGVIQTFSPYVEVETMETGKQTIALGPVASQVAIKQLGTNGGGFFNANSAHPFENPTPLTNFLEMIAIILIPAASVYMYGLMIGSTRHSWIIFSAMAILWSFTMSISIFSENVANPVIEEPIVLEGQETRFGTINSLLWTISTTSTANGSVNTMISSLSPLAGGAALFNIMMGEQIFGGVGVGLSSMLMMILLTVFLSGLMVGRTPEYLGKKIEKREIQWVSMAILLPGALVLVGAGLSCILTSPLSSLGNKGPHGLTELLYAFTSSSGNNGSAFSGLNVNTDYFNWILGAVMLLGRIAIVLPSLAIAGLLAKKKRTPASLGTFSTNSCLFMILLVFVILIMGGLTFFPALTLGPIVEQFLMLQGESF